MSANIDLNHFYLVLSVVLQVYQAFFCSLFSTLMWDKQLGKQHHARMLVEANRIIYARFNAISMVLVQKQSLRNNADVMEWQRFPA